MSILTSSAALTIADAATAVETIVLSVLPAPTNSSGTGRLIHPSFSAYDYTRAPDATENMLGDLVIAPLWSSTKTLLGAANTLFAGDVRDVIVEEHWTQAIACELSHLEALIAMWTTPPDPSVAYVKWWPNYISSLGFNVIILGLSAGGRGITTTALRNLDWVRGPVVLRMRIVGRL